MDITTLDVSTLYEAFLRMYTAHPEAILRKASLKVETSSALMSI